MKFNWKLFSGIATMTGMVIGAGFLGMPYVIAQSGFLIGLIIQGLTYPDFYRIIYRQDKFDKPLNKV